MMKESLDHPNHEGILLVNKCEGPSSFSLIKLLRKITSVKKIGHAGTLDPFAKGLMIYLIGKNYTKKSSEFINLGKEYIALCKLGQSTDSYDKEGQVQNTSDKIPSAEQLEIALSSFQGKIKQIPPMFSAKKIRGKKLYKLARKGIEVPRTPVEIFVKTTLISYSYPFVKLHISCSKGTYIRSIAHDLGIALGSYAHLIELERTKIGPFELKNSICQKMLEETQDFQDFLLKKIPLA